MLNRPRIPRPVVSQDEWLAARRALLAKEKEAVRLRDEVNAQRLALPWVRVDKPYTFDTPAGRRTLADLFAGRSQLIVYHFLLGPGWEAGCPGCSFLADHHDAALLHLAHRDVSLVAVSRAPFAALAAFKARMGWKFPWVSSHGSDFNQDFDVSSDGEERPAVSAFHRSESGEIFQTWGSDGSGDELLCGALNYLDLLPRGRETNANGHTEWLRHHDRY